jgi:hypothetical protein
MTNGHLPNHMAWIVYKHQLLPGVRYCLGTMMNNLEVADKLLHKEDYRTLNVVGVARSITKGCIVCIQHSVGSAYLTYPSSNSYVK